jgi:hypothetical protein
METPDLLAVMYCTQRKKIEVEQNVIYFWEICYRGANQNGLEVISVGLK